MNLIVKESKMVGLDGNSYPPAGSEFRENTREINEVAYL